MKFLNCVKKFLVDDSGPTAVEYAVMLSLIIVTCLVAIEAIGTNANLTFTAVGDKLGAAAGTGGGTP